MAHGSMCDMGGACNGATGRGLRRAGRVPAILSMSLSKPENPERAPDLAERIVSELRIVGLFHGTAREHSRAVDVARQEHAASPELAQVREVLDTLTSYAVAREYHDGPCLTRDDMQDARQALAALDRLMRRAKP